MADKTYKMTVTLSDGSTIDAGTFVAPVSPFGPCGATKGPALTVLPFDNATVIL